MYQFVCIVDTLKNDSAPWKYTMTFALNIKYWKILVFEVKEVFCGELWETEIFNMINSIFVVIGEKSPSGQDKREDVGFANHNIRSHAL